MDTPAGLTASDLHHTLQERGCDIAWVAAPGAAAQLAGREWRGLDDLDHDRVPGLLDAGPVVLALGRAPTSGTARSANFFASIARKVVAAAVVCTDERGRVLLVDDIFKGAWTLPGGLVDADESPAEAAAREAWEEGGVRVELGDLLGVFAHSHPDRIQLVYAARPVVDTPDPHPVHTHEVRASRWVHRAQAEVMLLPDVRRRLRACLDQPGRTWQW